MMPSYPWWQHQGRATRGWSWCSAAQISDYPRHGDSRNLEVWYKSGGTFLLHSAAEAACLFLIMGPQQCRAVPKFCAHSTSWSEAGIPMVKPSLSDHKKHKDEIKEPLLVERGEIYGNQTAWMLPGKCSQRRNLAHTVATSRHLKLSTIPF